MVTNFFLFFTETNKEIKKEHCPFNGNYTLQYKQYKPNYTVECIDSSSYINNCPVGSDLNIYFRDCPFENYGNFENARDYRNSRSYLIINLIYIKSH